MGKKKILNEKYKELDALSEKYAENNDTFFAILSPKEETNLVVHECGDKEILSYGFEAILRRACDFSVEDDKAQDIVDAFFDAIVRVSANDDFKVCAVMAKMLSDLSETCLDNALMRFGDDTCDAFEETCEACDSFYECYGKESKELKETKPRSHRRFRKRKNG